MSYDWILLTKTCLTLRKELAFDKLLKRQLIEVFPRHKIFRIKASGTESKAKCMCTDSQVLDLVGNHFLLPLQSRKLRLKDLSVFALLRSFLFLSPSRGSCQ